MAEATDQDDTLVITMTAGDRPISGVDKVAGVLWPDLGRTVVVVMLVLGLATVPMRWWPEAIPAIGFVLVGIGISVMLSRKDVERFDVVPSLGEKPPTLLQKTLLQKTGGIFSWSSLVLISDAVSVITGQLLLAGPSASQELVVFSVVAPLPVITAVSMAKGVRFGGYLIGLAVAVRLLSLILIWQPISSSKLGETPGVSDLVALAGIMVLGAWSMLMALATRRLEATSMLDRQRGSALRRNIITTVSHELRTPLTIIQGLTGVLTSRWAELEETKKLDMIDAIALNVASLDSSVLHFLDAGRLERGKWDLRRTETQIQPLVDAVVAKLEGVIAGRPLHVRVDVAAAMVDGEAMSRVVELLLVNACRFSKAGEHVSVRISSGLRGGVELAVSDRGRGIPARDLPHIFDPMWRSDVQQSGVGRGAGLGLTIVRSIADLHGARYELFPPKGLGPRFEFRFQADRFRISLGG